MPDLSYAKAKDKARERVLGYSDRKLIFLSLAWMVNRTSKVPPFFAAVVDEMKWRAERPTTPKPRETGEKPIDGLALKGAPVQPGKVQQIIDELGVLPGDRQVTLMLGDYRDLATTTKMLYRRLAEIQSDIVLQRKVTGNG